MVLALVYIDKCQNHVFVYVFLIRCFKKHVKTYGFFQCFYFAISPNLSELPILAIRTFQTDETSGSSVLEPCGIRPGRAPSHMQDHRLDRDLRVVSRAGHTTLPDKHGRPATPEPALADVESCRVTERTRPHAAFNANTPRRCSMLQTSVWESPTDS